jgi:hypothetical protein
MHIFKRRIIAILTGFFLTYGGNALAWVYPEHRDILLLAIMKLDTEHRSILDLLWSEARKGHEQRLNGAVIDATQNVNPKVLDYAAWSAIAGDHSTSPVDMMYNILSTDWIMDVADITARLKNGIASSTTHSEIQGELRTSDIRLLRADPDYVSRAGSNNSHFMLARPDAHTLDSSYFRLCSSEKSEVNAIGVYTWFHTSAILKAMRYAREKLTPEQQSALALSILADEAFALHFLEDGFASGHVAGIWGNASLRKGTHDYYDENGLEVSTWNGNRIVLTGDAYMRPSDAELASITALMSLRQILDAAGGKFRQDVFNDQTGIFTPDTFNIARAVNVPVRKIDPVLIDLYKPVLSTTPVPGLPTGLGEIPRFRSELGPFIGISPASGMSFLAGGFGKDQSKAGFVPGLEFAVHLGFGTDGVLNKSGDGLVFIDLGWRIDAATTNKILKDPDYKQFGAILSAIPSRETFYFRIRMPYYVIPGDMLILGPVLMLVAPKTLNKVVATAGQGGLIPWQTGLITPAGRFQFMLGREMGVYLYGRLQDDDAFLIPDDRTESGSLSLISMKTTRLDFPFLEYRPVRTFSRKQSANFFLQLTTGVDIPGKVKMKSPADIEPMDLKPVWYVGLRMGLDWRYYVSKENK